MANNLPFQMANNLPFQMANAFHMIEKTSSGRDADARVTNDKFGVLMRFYTFNKINKEEEKQAFGKLKISHMPSKI